MAKVCVVLSGCGYLDGAEVRETVLSLLYLDQAGLEVEIFAPDMAQSDVMHHIDQVPMQEFRNVLLESARLARGKITELNQASADAFDALFIPGGFGVAKNLSDLASKGSKCTVHPAFEALIKAFYEQKKPIGAICIAPAVVAAVLKNQNLTLTIGDDADTAAVIEACGNHHQQCKTSDAVIDEANKIATAPAYMHHDSIKEIAHGIEKVVQAVARML